MLTPYSENGAIDFEALTSLTEFYIAAGASGLFANCQSSEMFELSPQESLQLIEWVVKQANGRIPVVAASSVAGDMNTQAAFVKQIYALGVEAVILITGLIAGEDESDELFNKRVFQLFDLTAAIPLGFYECPEPYKRILSPQQLKTFVNTGKVIYHKDTSLDIHQVQKKNAATRGYRFGLYDAYMAHAVDSLKAGSAGLSCIQGNYFPELIVWLCEHFNEIKLAKEVNLVQQFMIDHMDIMHEVYPIVAKYFLNKRGLNISLFSRRAVGFFDNSTKLVMDKLYSDYVVLAEQIGLANDAVLLQNKQ